MMVKQNYAIEGVMLSHDVLKLLEDVNVLDCTFLEKNKQFKEHFLQFFDILQIKNNSVKNL